MTDINDFGEPLGYDGDPDPEDYQPAPVDLDALDEAACIALNSGDEAAKSKAAALVLQEAHRLIAECRAARERIAEWEALETHEMWAVTVNVDMPPGPSACEYATPELAESLGIGEQMWRRALSVHPWEPVADTAPF